jgi:hypothetical protein
VEKSKNRDAHQATAAGEPLNAVDFHACSPVALAMAARAFITM